MSPILADTSIWADHFRAPDPLMKQLLADHRIRMHPHVLGELRMGNLPNRAQTIDDLYTIHRVPKVDDEEVMQLIETGRLFGSGLSWVDAHLLTSVLVARNLLLWTRDRRLDDAAARYDRSASLHH